MSKRYAHYSVNDFDKYDCLKLSKVAYFVILFVMRAYIVWLISLSNFQDRTSIISIIYPEKQVFYLNLISGMLGLLLLAIVSLRRANAPSWVKTLWPHFRTLLVVALIFDFIVNVVAFFYWQLTSQTWLFIQLAITVYLIYKCIKNKRLSLNLKEFPEPLPEK